MSGPEKIISIPVSGNGNRLSKKIRLQHVLEVFSEFSTGDVEAGARAVQHLNIAQIRNTREIVSQSLRDVGRKSDVFVTYTPEVDPAVYGETVGMTQKSEDGSLFVATEVRKGRGGDMQLISLALTTRLKEDVEAILRPVEEQPDGNIYSSVKSAADNSGEMNLKKAA